MFTTHAAYHMIEDWFKINVYVTCFGLLVYEWTCVCYLLFFLMKTLDKLDYFQPRQLVKAVFFCIFSSA